MINKLRFILLLTFFSFHLLAASSNDYESALKSFHQQKYDETIIHLKNSLKQNSEHIPSRLLLVETLIGQGKGEMAETELFDLQTSGVDFNQTIALLAQSLVLQSKYKQLLDVATSGYRGNGIESKILFSRGQAYLGLSQLRSAENAFTDALILEPDYQLAKLGLAQIAINQNNFSKATKFVDEALLAYEPLPNAWIMKSVIHRIKGDYPQALSAINQALKINSENLQAILSRATLYIEKESWINAAQDLDVILDKIPAEPRAKYLRAIVSAKQGNNQESTAKLNEVIVTLSAIPARVMANNPSYYFLAGLTNFNFGNLEDARHYFQSFLAVKENDLSTLKYLAIIELRQNNPLTAKNILTKTNVYFPNNPAILTLLGVSLMELDNVDRAKYYFEQVVKLIPNYSPALSNLAQSEIESGNYNQAIANLLSAKKNDINNAQITLLLVESYIKSKQFIKAKILTAKLIAAQPNSSYFQRQHGIALGFSGDIKGAKKAFNQALLLDDDNIDVIIHLARIDLLEGSPEKAIATLEHALKKFPKNLFLIVELADLFAIINDDKQALVYYQRAFSYDNQNTFTLNKLVNYYFTKNQLEKIEPILLAYLQKQPKDVKMKMTLGRLYGNMNKPIKAIKVYKSVVNDAKNRTKVYILLAEAQLRVDDRSAAIKSLNKAIAWDENRIEPLLMLFPIILKQKNTQRAEQIIYTVKKLLPKQNIADILSAELFIMLAQYDKAELSYQLALSKNESQKLTLGLFQVLNKQKKYKEAQQLIELWLKKNPNDVIAEIALAESYVHQGHTKQALTFYEALLIKYKRMPILLNNMANIAFLLEKPKLALTYANEAYKKAPNNVSIIDTIAWIKSKEGNRTEAIDLFRQALVLDFDNAEIKYHLAVTLKEEMRNREAYKLLTEAVKAEQNFTNKSVAMQLLVQWRKEKSAEN